MKCHIIYRNAVRRINFPKVSNLKWDPNLDYSVPESRIKKSERFILTRDTVHGIVSKNREDHDFLEQFRALNI